MKSIFTFIFGLTVITLSAQTATITFSEDDSAQYVWLDHLSTSGQHVQFGQPKIELHQFIIEFEEEMERQHKGKGERFAKPRKVETHSETWVLRDTENLSLQIINSGPKGALSSSNIEDNILLLDKAEMIIRTFEVYDVMGRIVHSTIFDNLVNTIPLDHLSDGIFYLVSRDDNNDPLYSQKLALK